MTSPLVSIVIPTFRRPGPLREALESALRADPELAVEALVLDDDPARSGRAVVDAVADPRVQYRAFEPPTGGRPAKVRNLGLQLARGKYLHFLDDDDRVVPGAYGTLSRALDAQPAAGVAYGVIEAFGDDPAGVAHERAFLAGARKRALAAGASRLRQVAMLAFGETFVVNSSGLFRAETVRAVGGYDESFGMFEDIEMYVRVLQRSPGIFVDAPVLERRVGPSLVHDLQDSEPIADAYRQMHRKLRRSLGSARFYATKVAGRVLKQFA